MRLVSLFLIGVLMSSSTVAYDLAQHLWQDRLLILAAPSRQDPDLERLREIVRERSDAVIDRDLRVFELAGLQGWRDGEPLAESDVRALRAHYGIGSDEQTMILVGLDGGEKRRTSLDTALRELFVQIDGMPMRQADIRAKRAAGRPVTEP